MEASFIELPAFSRYRDIYLDDDEYSHFQSMLLANPFAGDLIKGTGGLRKVRFRDKRHNRGKRGGMRIIYYWWMAKNQFWLFTVYDKTEMNDLTSKQCDILADLLATTIYQR